MRHDARVPQLNRRIMRNVASIFCFLNLFSILGTSSFELRRSSTNCGIFKEGTDLYRHRSSMRMTNIEAWLDYTGSTDVQLVPNYYVDCILIDESHTDLLKSVPNQLPQSRQLLNRGEKMIDASGRAIGAIIEVGSAAGQNRALSLIGSVEWIALRCIGTWKMIPVENLIAACDGTATKLAVFVDSVDNLPGIFFSLQLGPHAVILSPLASLWDAFDQLMSTRIMPKTTDKKTGTSSLQRLEEAVVTSVTSGGIGDRVCIDLIQLLRLGEGLLVGSSSKLLALVHGETFEGEFVPSRPFRVNAGPVHSYVLMADGSTKYLSEAVAGDAVKVIDASKHTAGPESKGEDYSLSGRAVTVGRCKIESRPMLMVNYRYSPRTRANIVGTKSDYCGEKESSPEECFSGQVFLQQAETVRLVAPHLPGKAIPGCFRTIPVTELLVGDTILVLKNDFGTHVGTRISAAVVEK